MVYGVQPAVGGEFEAFTGPDAQTALGGVGRGDDLERLIVNEIRAGGCVADPHGWVIRDRYLPRTVMFTCMCGDVYKTRSDRLGCAQGQVERDMHVCIHVRTL